MFLASLTEKQKLAYLDLSYNLIAADGLLDRDEVMMMDQYKQEMNLTVQLSQLSHEADQAIAEFQSTNDTVKKQVLFELAGLAYADNKYVKEEQLFLEKICNDWNLNLSVLESCKKYVNKLMDLYNEIGRFIAD